MTEVIAPEEHTSVETVEKVVQEPATEEHTSVETVEEAVEEVATESATKEEVGDDKPVEPEEKKEGVKARNMRLLAKSKDRLARANQQLAKEKFELQAKLKEYEQNRTEQSRLEQTNKDEYEDVDFEETDSVNNKMYKQNQDLYNRNLKLHQEQQQIAQQVALDKVEYKIQKKYSDFADVVSTTNVSVLEELDPELTKQIVAEPDLYKKAVKTYDAIRKHEIYETANKIDANKKMILDNIAKPKSASTSASINKSNSSVFADLHSADYQNQLRRELEESRSKV